MSRPQGSSKPVAAPASAAGKGMRGAQYRDPATGRPEIETVLAYAEPPPPAPRPKKRSTSKPLPWKVKEITAKHEADASLKKVQQLMWGAIKEQEKKKKNADDDLTPSEVNVRLQKELPNGPIPVTNAPQHMGTARIVSREQTAPFSRDIAPAALAHTNVKPLGGNLPPPDGRKKLNPMEGHDPATDIIAFRPKPAPQMAAPTPLKQPPPVDIFGRPVPVAPPPLKEQTNDEELKSANEHYKKVMSRDRHILVDIARSKASDRIADPAVGDEQEFDIFGKPVKAPKVPVKAARQGMFAGDSEPVSLFSGAGGKPLQPLSEQARAAMTSFPSYIVNPPENQHPDVTTNPVAKIGERPNKGPGVPPKVSSTKTDQTHHIDFAVPGLGESKTSAPPAFYKSSTFRKILVGCGLWGLRPLRQLLRAMDKNADGILTRHEFKNACLKASLDFSEPELTALMSLAPPHAITPEGKPSLIPPKPDFPNFVLIPLLMDVLRGGDLPVRRRMAIVAAFQAACKAAKKPTYSLTLEDILNVTDFSAHPEFAPHVKGSLREIMQAYSAAWGDRKGRTSVISEDEFIGFYADFSPLIGNDTDFIRIIGALHGKPA